MERKRLPLERPPLFTAIFCDDSVERLSRQAKAAWTMVDNRFDFKTLDPTLDGVEKPRTVKTPCRFGFTKRIPEPDNVVQWCREAGRVFPDTVTMLKPGTYALAVSVGSRIGTPEIALPLEGQIGETRRYAVGRINVFER